jgi:hypothetical protein
LTFAGPAARAEINQPAATPSDELTPAMIAPPTATARNERPKLARNATARNSSSTANDDDRDHDRDVVVADQ